MRKRFALATAIAVAGLIIIPLNGLYTYIYSRSTTTAILHLSKVLILLLLLIPYLLGLYSNIEVDQMRKQYDFKIKETYFEITRLPKPLQSRFRRLHLP